MSDDQPRSAPRFSRFSRTEATPSHPSAEPSLEEIAARALNRPRSTTARAQRGELPSDFGSPEGFGVQSSSPPGMDEYQPEPRRHAPPPPRPQHIPDVVPVERVHTARPKPTSAAELLARSARATRAEPPVEEPVFTPPPEIVIEAEPVPESQFTQPEPEFTRLEPEYKRPEPQLTRPERDFFPAEPEFTPEFEISPPPLAAAPHVAQIEAPAPKQRFKMPSLPTLKPRGKSAPAEGDEAKKAGPNVAQRALAAARAKAVPALQKSAFWLAHNLQRRELRKRYSEAIIFTHNRILDRKLEKLFFVPTLKGAIKAPAPDRGILYEGPIPASVFDWAFTAINEDLREFVFVDFRASRGRTMLLAAKHNFDRIIGFEFDPELFDDLQMNIAQYPRSLMKCRNIDCYRGDLDGIRIPDQPSVLWFSGTWREDMIPGVMDYVRETYRQSPRRLYVVFANAEERPVLEGDEMFYRVDPGINQRLKLKLLSPMDFQIYRTMT